MPISIRSHIKGAAFHLLRGLSRRSKSSSKIYESNLNINKLVRDGDMDGACKLFEEMPMRDAVSWNTMIAAYCGRRDFNKSKSLFQQMPEKTIISWNSMISASFQSGDVDQAFQYFRQMPRRNTSSWNGMISGLVKCDRIDEAERLFLEMPLRNVISYTSLIDGFCRCGNIRRARHLFDKMKRRNSVSWAVMINGYVQNGLIEEAGSLSCQMPGENVVAATAMVAGYCREGRLEDAREIFMAMHGKDVVSWNAMMSGYVNNERGQEALRLYVQMLQLGIRQDCSTLLILLMACSIISSISSGRQIHATGIKTGLNSDISVSNTCITMYSKCGSIGDSNLIFKTIQTPDLVSWNNIISAFGQHGLYEEACTMLHKLTASGFIPDNVTFLSILSACGRAGKVNDSIIWFKKMVCDYGMSPRSEHFSCLVDSLSRAGLLTRACEVIKRMPFEADGSVWSALLGACQGYLNIDLAEAVAKRLAELKPLDSGTYVMLSNIYAAVGEWAEVMKVRRLMKKQGVQKQPGHSWIELGGSVHVFLGGDTSHPDTNRIHSDLEVLHLQMTLENVEYIDLADFSKISNQN
ncbi:pentatricopeptide repeat-containing protein At4g21300-like isoform X2 [Wolffia australiana]